MVATVKLEGILIVLEREKQIKRIVIVIVCVWCEIIILFTSSLLFCLLAYFWMKRKRRMSRLDGRWVSPKQKIRKGPTSDFLLVQFSVPWKKIGHTEFFYDDRKKPEKPGNNRNYRSGEKNEALVAAARIGRLRNGQIKNGQIKNGQIGNGRIKMAKCNMTNWEMTEWEITNWALAKCGIAKR